MSGNESSPISGQSRPGDLPQPDKDAMAHSLKLCSSIQEQIRQSGGHIAFDRFMHSALYLPGMGYYRCGSEKFGVQGDFVTAPEVSVLFGQSIAQFIQQIDVGDSILEIGAGRGLMAADILLALDEQDALPANYCILELSAELIQRQRQTLSDKCPQLLERVVWLDRLPQAFRGVVIANELLDAMPVTRFCVKGDTVYQQHVVCNEGVFGFKDIETQNPRLLERVALLKQQGCVGDTGEYRSEVNFVAEDWIKGIAEILTSAVMVLIDYGYPRSVYYHAQRNMGTLMCYYRHRGHPDPLILVGLQDITAHVDFTAMADAALDANMEILGFATQAHFLLNLGLLDRVGDNQDDLTSYLRKTGEIKRLTLPGEMGETFKVMVLAKDYAGDIPGFEQFDIRHTL